MLRSAHPEPGHFDNFSRLHKQFLYFSILSSALVLLGFILLTPAPLYLQLVRDGMLVALLVSLPWLRHRPDDRHHITALIMASTVVATLAQAMETPAQQFPDVIDQLPLMCFATTVFGTEQAAGLLSAGCILGLAALIAAHPWLRIDPFLRHLANLILVLVLQQVVLRGYWRIINQAMDTARLLSKEVEAIARTTQDLALDTFQGARTRLASLRLSIDGGANVQALESIQALQTDLIGARKKLADLSEPPPPGDIESAVAGLRLRMRGYIQWAICLALAAALVWNSLLPPLPHQRVQWVFLGFFAVMLVLRSLYPSRERLFFRLSLAAFLCISELLAYSQVSAGSPSFPANQCGVALALLLTALMDGPGATLLVLGFFLATLVAHALAYPAMPVLNSVFIAFSCSLTCWAAQSLPLAIFRNLAAQERALDAAIRRRRRFISMLFHDLANPLHVISSQVGWDQDPARASRLLARMEGVLVAAQQLDRYEVVLQPIALDRLLEGLDDLYRERLSEKGLSLAVQCIDATVSVQPQLLRESVLGNLLSNAIKFAPEGSAIAVASRRSEGFVELSVQDSGPGIPESVHLALSKGRSVSRAAQGGEGFGYGLNLAQDYLAQMGGELALGRAPSGGTLAVMRLREA